MRLRESSVRCAMSIADGCRSTIQAPLGAASLWSKARPERSIWSIPVHVAPNGAFSRAAPPAFQLLTRAGKSPSAYSAYSAVILLSPFQRFSAVATEVTRL
jgi:hypothetical protein